jgi:hypothetical protein
VKSKDYLHKRPDSGIFFYVRKVPKMVMFKWTPPEVVAK